MSKIECGFTFHTVPNRFFHKFEAFGKSSAFSDRYTYKILMRTTFGITQNAILGIVEFKITYRLFEVLISENNKVYRSLDL